MEELLKGLSQEDADAVRLDFNCFGRAMVHVEADGTKRYLPPSEWPTLQLEAEQAVTRR